MQDLGKALVVIGLIIAVIGAVVWSGFGRGWLGRLPGDIHYHSPRGHFSFYFPFMTCLIVSLILTLLLWLFRKR